MERGGVVAGFEREEEIVTVLYFTAFLFSACQSTVQSENNMMSNVSSSVDPPNNSSDDALNNSINTNVVDEEEPHIQDFQESVRSTYYHSPNGTRYWTPNVLEAYRPVLGTVFAKEEDAISMYQSYAEKAGFDIRLSTTKKSKDGTVRLRYVLCSRSGKPNCQNVDSMVLKSSSKLPRSSNYKVSDCKAKIKVKVFKGYPGLRLYEFVESHNHPLVSIENMDLTRKRRQLEFSDQDFIHRLSLAKVGPSTAFKMQAVLKGGQHNVRGTNIEYKNFSKDLRAFIGKGDAQMVVNMMDKRKVNLENYYCHYIIRHGELRSLFWADEVMKCNYRVFGEVLAFDATYSTNQYNMIFVPFTGVDHHKNCVTFAAALLYDETIESFTWMLEQFLETHDEVMKCNYRVFGEVLAFDATYSTNQYNMIFVPFTGVDHHKNCVTFAAALLYDETIESFTWMLEQFLETHVKQPRLVLTDQDPAMKQAIAKVFNESVHRLCMWHIMDKLPHKIDGDVLQNTNLRRHKWLSDMFSIRDQWVPGYFRDIPMCCLMKTTSRCESSNALFKVNSSASNTLVQFMLCFEIPIDGQRYRQRVSEHKTESISAALSTPLPIEAHAALVYTRSIFKEVPKEISKALLSCMNGRPNVVDGYEHYTVSHFEKGTVIGDYTVKINPSDNSVTCSCMLFTRIGYLCRHVFSAYRFRGINKIPDKYIAPRWKKDALPKKVFNLEFRYGVDSSESFKLRSEALNLAQQCGDRLRDDSVKLAWFVEQIRAIKNTIFEEVTTDPSSKNKGGVFEELIGESQPDSVSFVAPQGIRNKGCGTSRRLIGPGEKAKVKSKKKKRNCKFNEDNDEENDEDMDEDSDEDSDVDGDEDSDEDSHEDSDGE
ncbi:protein FAR1-RELATED SEQUENCE 5-like [Helianthus annuus]|uniref:protein FAR1-RELATED SEQUENCE 5-like n=1 Tax=Helianthus annuus TaxID=4232 RepID=UPI0016530529|nr:protein FAR1-RELATED SEQUENCE 5-like [Helianthus annuus]